MDLKSIRERARLAFKANYWPCVLVSLILSVLTGLGASAASTGNGGTTSTSLDINVAPEEIEGATLFILVAAVLALFAVAIVVSLIIRIFITNPLTVGSYQFFKRNLDDPTTGLDTLGIGFKNYGRTFLTLFLRDLFIFLWSLLFFIPGIVKGYAYSLTPFIIEDNPELSPKEAIKYSEELMNGHKMDAFKLDLSFIGWILLTIITCGVVGVFWTMPYMYSADAAFYQEVLAEKAQA